MPRKAQVRSSHWMTERQRKNWENRTKRGGAFKIPGAFNDDVFVPRSTSDVDPQGATQRNRLRLRQMREIINHNKGRKSRSYIA